MPHPLAYDTPLAAEARQIAFFQQRTPTERLGITCELTAFAFACSRAAVRRLHPHLDPLAQERRFAQLTYGPAHADRMLQAPTIEGSQSIPAALLPLTRALTQLHVPYYVGGSIASTAYSLPRATYDIDVAAALGPSHVSPLIAGLAPVYSIDHASVREAIAHPDREASFTIIHHETGIPLDIVVTADRPFDQSRYDRAQEHCFPGTAEPITLASPEDVILNKLRCSYQDGISSQQQWRDVASIIRVQDQHLDQSYLRSWATSLGIRPLLDAALRGDAPPAGPAAPPEPGRRFSHTSASCG